MKTPKYVLWIDHTAGNNSLDTYKSLEAKDVLSAMTETTNMTKFEENMYCAILFERIPKTDEYKQILRTGDGDYFVQVDGGHSLTRYHDSNSEWYA